MFTLGSFPHFRFASSPVLIQFGMKREISGTHLFLSMKQKSVKRAPSCQGISVLHPRLSSPPPYAIDHASIHFSEQGLPTSDVSDWEDSLGALTDIIDGEMRESKSNHNDVSGVI